MRQWPGPSATMISAAPSRLHSSMTAATTLRIRVDDLVAMILDQVRLEDDALALERNRRPEMLVLLLQDAGEIGVVIRPPGRCGRRNWPATAGDCSTALSGQAAEPGADAARPSDFCPAGSSRPACDRALGGMPVSASRKELRRADAERERHQGVPMAAGCTQAPSADALVGGGDAARRAAVSASATPGMIAVADRGRASPSRGVRGRRRLSLSQQIPDGRFDARMRSGPGGRAA